MATRAVHTREAIAKVDLDHAKGGFAIKDLQHLLLGWDFMEETIILQAALQVLRPAYWTELDTAFQSNRDALTGTHPVEATYEQLFSRIAHLAPAHHGMCT